MPGKLIETSKLTTLIVSERLTSTDTILYNGSTSTGNGLDTRDYDDCVIHLNIGTLSAGTYTISILESATDNAALGAALSGSDFTTVTTAADDGDQIGSIQCSGTKRYLWVETVSGLTAGNFDIGAVAILTKSDENPIDNDEVFDI